ncbi:MAG: PqqD family protein [Myxococcales bacterium]
MEPGNRLLRAGGVAQRTIGEETVLVPVRTSPRQRVSVLTLNEVGSLVWAALAEPRTAGELAELVASEFEVAVERAAADIEAFLAKLGELDLVKPA